MNYLQLVPDVITPIKLLNKAQFEQREITIPDSMGWFPRYEFQCYDYIDRTIKVLSVGKIVFDKITYNIIYGDQRLYHKSTEYCFIITRLGTGIHTRYSVKPLTKQQYKSLTVKKPVMQIEQSASLVTQIVQSTPFVPQKWWQKLLIGIIKKFNTNQRRMI